MAHDTEVKSVLRAYKKALDALQRLDKARRDFRSALLTAHEAGANKAELARALGVSRQRVDEVLTRARDERAAGGGGVTNQGQKGAGGGPNARAEPVGGRSQRPPTQARVHDQLLRAGTVSPVSASRCSFHPTR